MELIDVMYELAATKSALDIANHKIRQLKRGSIGCKLVIAGLVYFGASACKMLGESESKRKEAEKRADQAEAACIEKDAQILEARSKYACECCANYEKCSSTEV